MIASSTHSVVSLVLQFGSILFFWFFYSILSIPVFSQHEILGSFRMLMSWVNNWMLLIFFAMAYCCLEYCLKLMYDNLNNVYQYQKMLEERSER